MIKINLLAPEQRKKKRGKRKSGAGPSLQGTGLLAIFGIALVLELAGLFW